MPTRLANTLKTTVRSAVNRLGYDVVRLRNSHASLSTHLANVLQVHGIDCVLDVGANAGQYGQFLRELGFKGHIVSFEPVKEVFNRLTEAAKGDSRWHCYDLALGDRDETRTMNVYSSTVFSSFLEATDYSKRIWKSLEDVRSEDVAVVRLDTIFEDLKRRTRCRSFYLKMDTQGFDKNVFAGAQGSLADVRALQSELSFIPVYKGNPSAYEMLAAFHAHGFQISGMYPINRDNTSLAVIEYDCVLVRGAPATPAAGAGAHG